jgi:hypothetical protein
MAVGNIFQMANEFANLFHSKAVLKFTQFGIFGMKIYHLATLDVVGNNGREHW